jgi:hypothetical protein
MSEMTLFGKKSTGVSSKFSGLQSSVASTLTGGGQGNRRISIKGGVFREIVGGKEVRTNDDRSMNVVIIKAAAVSRMYFGGAYVEGETSKPTCWSNDSNTPAKEVPEAQRQSARCKGCKQDIKGSGQNDSRACKFQQRVAVMLEGDIACPCKHMLVTAMRTTRWLSQSLPRCGLIRRVRHRSLSSSPCVS